MIHRKEQYDGILETVRRALNEELPKALETALSRLSERSVRKSTSQELLSRKQAAEVLGVSLQTIASLIDDGTLECVRIRRRVLVPYRSILQRLEQRDPIKQQGESR